MTALVVAAGVGATGVGVAVLVGRADSPPARPSPSPSPRSSPYEAPHRAACDAAAHARSGRLDDARRVFFDRVHDPLHALAAAVADHDRGAAAALLEAKETVERDLGGRSPAGASEADPSTATTGVGGPPGGDADRRGPALATHLDRLASAVSSAAVAAGAPEPRPCPAPA